MGSELPATDDVALDRDLQIKVGQQLRRLYDDIVAQELPAHLCTLLERLVDRLQESTSE